MPDASGGPSRRQMLHAGPLSVVLDGSFARFLRIGDQEVARGMYVAVRDRSWGTIEPRFLSYALQSGPDDFTLRFTAEHVSSEIDFVWDGALRGDASGTLSYAMDGIARRTFLRNRIGFCILHPMSFAGVPVEVDTPGGVVRGAFPVRIAPHQPLLDMRGMRYELGGVSVEMRFEGDLFEMEDQRNWTDASYKTYCTPLSLPYPVRIEAGTRIRQSIVLSIRGPVSRHAATATPDRAQVWSGHTRLGKLPPVGLSLASHGRALSAIETRRLRALRLAHLRVALDVLRPDWPARLALPTAHATALGVALELEVVTDAHGEGLEQLAPMLAANQAALARILVFDAATSVTGREAIQRLRTLLRAAAVDVPVGGGSRLHFTEFNRADLPLDLFDLAGYSITPQVHAFDDLSMVENLAAQAVTVSNARQIVGEMPLSIGPITLKPRSSATAGDSETPAADLPAAVDPRQSSLFAAGWTVGSLQGLGSSGVDWLTYYETSGWAGVLNDAGAPTHAAFGARPGTTFPVYHVLADLAGFVGGDITDVRLSDDLVVQALALRAGRRVRLLVANVTGESCAVELHVPRLVDAGLRVLDETSATRAAEDPEGFREQVDTRPDGAIEHVRLDLRPWAVVRLDGRLA